MAISSYGIPGPAPEPITSDPDAGNEDEGPNVIVCDTHTEVTSK